MTAIKQVSITSARHAKNVARYLNDERALARSSQNLFKEKRWEKEMDATRESYGHNKPSRAGAKNTIMYHRVIAFNPDECDLNGGRLSASNCMKYAKEYAQKYLPAQECVWVLHKEHCKADGTDRYAIHMAINRTNLETGNRFDQGRTRHAKIERANQIRDMDKEWGLRQLEKGKRNSRVHARQMTREEKQMQKRGERSNKKYIREAVQASMRELKEERSREGLSGLRGKLAEKGVSCAIASNKRDITFTRDSTGFKVNGSKLGRGFSAEGIERALEFGRSLEMTRNADRNF